MFFLSIFFSIILALLCCCLLLDWYCINVISVVHPQKQVKYRHRRENDEDENFIALAPADGDEFNLESVLSKDKQMPAIVRLDPVSDQEEDEDNDNYSELSTKEESDDSNNNDDNDKNYDADKFNRFFDSVDINEEQKRIFNESLNGDSVSLTSSTPIFGRINDDTDDYLGEWIFYVFFTLS